MKDITQPHDRLFRYLFGNVHHVATYLRNVLPRDMLNVLDLNHLELVPTTFITELFKEKRVDMLIYVPRKEQSSDEPGMFVYFLFEHQRKPDHLMPMRLVGYVLAILDRAVQDMPAKRKVRPLKLPAVVPIVLYQGRRTWNVARQMGDMFDLEGLDKASQRSMRPYLLNQRYILHNLQAEDDATLASPGVVRVALVVMKHIDSPNLLQVLRTLLDDIREAERDPNTDLQDVRMILRYILSASEHVTKEKVLEVVEPLGEELREIVMTEAQRLIQQGIEQGIEQGIQQGIEQGTVRGARQERQQIARVLLQDGMTPENVARVTGLSLRKVLELRES